MPHLKPAALAAAFLIAVSSAALAETATGYVVLDVKDGTVLAQKNAERPFIPASVLKMPTALAVLDTLGAEHRFTTRVMHTGSVSNGVLEGDIVLVGGGDPMLDTPALEGMAKALAAAGVTRVTGRFLYDDSAVLHRDAIEARQPADASYNPGLAGLSLDFNRFKVRWNEGSPTGAEVPLDPLPVALTMPPEQSEVWVPVREPGRFTARMFHWLAAKQSITLPLPEPGPAPAEASELVRNESLPVAEILRRALIHSNNMTTDTVLIAAAQKALGRTVRLEEAGEWLAARTKE
ncbi:MAG: D-alanyl-D-alanine carboxypeptidase, partial [Rhodospirillaceae bacterium]